MHCKLKATRLLLRTFDFLYFTGKLASEIFRKVRRKELNLLLVSLST